MDCPGSRCTIGYWRLRGTQLLDGTWNGFRMRGSSASAPLEAAAYARRRLPIARRHPSAVIPRSRTWSEGSRISACIRHPKSGEHRVDDGGRIVIVVVTDPEFSRRAYLTEERV